MQEVNKSKNRRDQPAVFTTRKEEKKNEKERKSQFIYRTMVVLESYGIIITWKYEKNKWRNLKFL